MFVQKLCMYVVSCDPRRCALVLSDSVMFAIVEALNAVVCRAVARGDSKHAHRD
jgi:hypothetical protein